MFRGGIPHKSSRLTSFTAMKQKLIVAIRAISIMKAFARAVNVVISKCLNNRGAYVGALSSWSLDQCEAFDKIFATEIHLDQECGRLTFLSAGAIVFPPPSLPSSYDPVTGSPASLPVVGKATRVLPNRDPPTDQACLPPLISPWWAHLVRDTSGPLRI